MTDKPIIFSVPMVRALLEGRKTQTRRVLKPNWLYGANPNFTGWRPEQIGVRDWGLFCSHQGGNMIVSYAVGDRLWVRETLDMGFAGGFPICVCTYGADGAPVDLRPSPYWAGDRKRNCVPSIHMPRWASRLTLIVESVKVERVQDISEVDAIAEGIYERGGIGDDPMHDRWTWQSSGWRYSTPREAYHALWNSIHAKKPEHQWGANPWVAAISFRVIRANIDSLEAPNER